jgi:aspartyl-tRNA(Asn)/glutamyl-tRNA(Gln) amidotransferase subunit A
MIAFASSLDQGGPMARSAADAALLLQAMAGFDPRDSTSVDAPVPDYRAALAPPLTGMRIGIAEGVLRFRAGPGPNGACVKRWPNC